MTQHSSRSSYSQCQVDAEEAQVPVLPSGAGGNRGMQSTQCTSKPAITNTATAVVVICFYLLVRFYFLFSIQFSFTQFLV